MKVDTADLNSRDSHDLLVNIVAPRPIAWVSTVNQHGIYNLAPFSFYTVVSSKPALIGIGISPKRDGQKKDTLRNIALTKEFVINVVDESLAKVMNQTSAPYPSDVSEFKEAGLTPVKADLVKAPLMFESSISLECRLSQVLEFGEAPQTHSFIIGEILRIHINDELCAKGEIQGSKIKAIGRLGGDRYCRIQDVFEMKRPD
jgi:flavin reductase (DIM6/NTAB) family NADH-FMN oxidoreductase RutF